MYQVEDIQVIFMRGPAPIGIFCERFLSSEY